MIEKIFQSLWVPPQRKVAIEKQAQQLWSSTDLLQGLSRRSIHKLVQASDLRHYKTDEVLFHAGDAGVAVGLVVSGQLRIENGDIEIATLEPGMLFGETALLSDAPRTASVSALSDSNVALLTRFQVEEFILHRPQDGARLMSNLARLLASRLQQIYSLGKDA